MRNIRSLVLLAVAVYATGCTSVDMPVPLTVEMVNTSPAAGGNITVAVVNGTTPGSVAIVSPREYLRHAGRSNDPHYGCPPKEWGQYLQKSGRQKWDKRK